MLPEAGNRMPATDVEPTTPTPGATVNRPAVHTLSFAAAAAALVLTLAAVAGWRLLGDDEPAPASGPSITNPSADAARAGSGPTTPVDLPTSDWRPGDGGDDALITGMLITDRSNCVVLGHRGGRTTYALWPAGYTAAIGTDGVVRLRDAEGEVVAESGDELELGGGFHEVSEHAHPCIRGKGEVAVVQSEVTVARESEHWLPREAAPRGAPGDRAFLAWRERTPFRSCGEQFLAPFLDGTGLAFADCMRDALRERRTAEAVVTLTTVEGDPVTTYLRLRRNGTVEVFTDATQDKFGSGTWERRTCRRLDEALRLSC
ncbi:hypothetical protein NODU109028_01990 [Nocardioides dubius]